MDKIIYLKGPVYRKTGRHLHGRHYGIDWVDGYAGPFYKGGLEFYRLWGRCPSGTTILDELEFFDTEVGQKNVRSKRASMDRLVADQDRRDKELLHNAEVALRSLTERYEFQQRYGLVDAPESIWKDIRLGIDSTKNKGGDQLTRNHAWRRVLKYVAAHGAWDGDRFKTLKDEWQRFHIEVVSRVLDGSGNKLPVQEPDYLNIKLDEDQAESAEIVENIIELLDELDETVPVEETPTSPEDEMSSLME